jgi:TonB-linked SusC/RagA family outer membrane protein
MITDRNIPLLVTLKKIALVMPLLLLGLNMFAQQHKSAITATSAKVEKMVSGIIKDAITRKALGGATITYGNTFAVITDSTGKFVLKVPDYNVTISVSSEGFQTKEIALKGQKNIIASLYESDFQSFYDDITIPFKTLPQSQLTVAAQSVQSKGNWNYISETPDAFLQGKVAGLQVIRRSGTPNMGANLFIRGFSSLYATNQPLVVIDGVIFDTEPYGQSLNAGYYNNALSFVDIKDIDNVTVLKDATSTYGTKGANGVIIVTTVRARQEATNIDVALYGGINIPPSSIPVMGTNDYRIYLSEMLQSKGLPYSDVKNLPYMNDEVSNVDYYRYHNNIDWQKQVFNTSTLQNGYLKITGGDNVAKYGLTMGYAKNGEAVRGTSMVRYNTRFNADFKLSSRLTAATNLSFTYSEQKLKDFGISPKTNPIFAALVKAPFLPLNEMDNSGTASPILADKDIFNVSNPLALTQNMQAVNKSYRFVGSANFNYRITPNISVASTVAITMDKIRESFFDPQLGIVSDTLSNAVANNSSGSQVLRLFTIFNDTRISYNKTFNNIHHLDLNLGFRYSKTNTEQDYGLGYNSATDQLTGVGYGVNALRNIGGSLGESKWLNTYLNADYNLRGKYFVGLNMAVDGSSKFGTDVSDAFFHSGNKSYALLPSLSAAWLISSEKFMAGNKLTNLLKIRASIGETGNEDIGNYTARKYYVAQNLLGMEGLVRNNTGNPNLQWESVIKLNAGVDVALFDERLSFSVDAYQNKTNKMIVYEPASTVSGLDYMVTNSSAMKTTGWEASINVRAISRSSFKWDIGLNIAHNKSIITALPQDRILTDYADGTILTKVGNAPNLFYGYKTNGIYTSGSLAASEGLSIKNTDGISYSPFKGGDVRFVNTDNSDKVITESDRQVIGNPNPKFYGALTNRVVWKKWTVDAVITFSQGNDIYNYTRRQLESMSGYANQTKYVINRWRTDGQITSVPKAAWGDPMGNSRFSDRWIEDGSYIKLRTLAISYNVPLKVGAIKSLVVYFSGNNLLTLTKYLGYDPEFSATSSIFGQGVDVTMEPLTKTMQVGLKLGL